jgi:hypothetical protein
VNSNNGCPVEKFKLCDKIDCLKVTNVAAFTIEGETLKVDVSKSINLTVYITPVTISGIIEPQPIKIKVCGSEIISAKDQAPIVIQLVAPETGELSYDVATLYDDKDP